MKVNLNIDVDNKTFFLRYLPSILVVLLVTALWFWSGVISQFGNRCTTMDASGFMSEELSNSTLQLTASMLTFIQNKNYKDAKRFLADNLGDLKTIKENLEPVRQMLPQHQIQDMTIVSVDIETSYTGTYKYDRIATVTEVNYPYSDFVVEMLQFRVGDQVTIEGFRVHSKRDLVAMFQSSWKNATGSAYLTIFLMFIITLIILYALILCINTDIKKHKWLWVLFIIVGFCGIDFNWSAQEFMVNPISIRLLGIGWFKANCFSPMVLTFSIPVGAIVFLYKHYKPKFNKLLGRKE